ncbi:MAG: DUF1800 domain-containing protein [Vulcanimicrobiota bacterium]
MARDYLVKLLLGVALLGLARAGQADTLAYREAGLTRREAAAHLLSRFTFGARPGEVDQVLAMGLDKWLDQQLDGDQPEPPYPGTDNNYGNLRGNKLNRALNSPNQLREVLTDFWFNHFNVSARGRVNQVVTDYEAQIRKASLGNFRELLGTTAHHPAMLIYLNNDQSRAPPPGETLRVEEDPFGYGPASRAHRRPTDPLGYGPPRRVEVSLPSLTTPNRRGINENYARELMELHTLGVDGGYRQQDVIEVARVLTGWTVEGTPPTFRYNDDLHDNGTKTVLHRTIHPAGQKEGEQVLDLLCGDQATARHVCRKLAVRFVSDHPSEELVRRLARRYLGTGGNIRLVLRELVAQPEFWRSRRQKVKSPFEVVASALRALDARVDNYNAAVSQVEQMGQALYQYEAPTGFPDRADFWINPGSLVARMTFGLDLAEGRVGGTKVDLEKLVPAKQATSAREALRYQAETLLPDRPIEPMLKDLVPSLEDPDFAQRVRNKRKGAKPSPRSKQRPKAKDFDSKLVLGILLGSPEFQRR